MSYCRFSESDVYMFHSTGGFVECCACALAELVDASTEAIDTLSGKSKEPGYKPFKFKMHGSKRFDTFQGALDHLLEHVKAGHNVPDYAIDRLKKDVDSGSFPAD